MDVQVNPRLIDLGVVVCVNLFNLLLVVLFWGRLTNRPKIERIAGISTLILGIPLTLFAIANLLQHRQWWTVALPLLLVLFILIELLFDYILKIEFRQTWQAGPYLLIYYLGSMVMVGYAFMVKVPYGVITLITYFMQVSLGVYSRYKTGL